MTTEHSYPHPQNLLLPTSGSPNDMMADLNLLSKSSPSQLPQFQLKRSRAQPIPLPTATASTDYSSSHSNHGRMIVTSPPNGKLSNLSHVPCKFFKQGTCTAGANCTFSHSSDLSSEAAICKYFLKGNCKFGSKCALLHTMSIFHPHHQQHHHQLSSNNSSNSKKFLSSSVNSHLYNLGHTNAALTTNHNGNRRRQQTTSSSLSDQMMLLSISPPLSSQFQTPLPSLPTPTTPSSANSAGAGASTVGLGGGGGGGGGNRAYLFHQYQDPFFGTSAPPSTTMTSSFFQQHQATPTAGMWRQHSNGNNIASPPLTAGGLRHVSASTASTAEAFGTSPLFISGSTSTSSHPNVNAASRFHQYASSSFSNSGRKSSMTHDYFDSAFNDRLLEEERERYHPVGSEEELDDEEEDIHALNDAMLPSSLNHDVFTPKELQLRMHRQRQQSLTSSAITSSTAAVSMMTKEWPGSSAPLENNNKNWRVPFYTNSKQQQQPLNKTENSDNGSAKIASAINIPGSIYDGNLHHESSRSSTTSSHGSNNHNSNSSYLLQQPLRQEELTMFSSQDDEVQFFMEDDTTNAIQDATTIVLDDQKDDKKDQKMKGYDDYHKTSDVTNKSANSSALFPSLLSMPISSKKSM